MLKLKRKLLFGRLLYIIHLLILLAISFIFDRLIQMLTFIVLFNVIHNSFKYRFHSDSIIDDPIKAVRVCKVITICIEIIYLIICLKLEKSIYSNLLFIFFICFTNALLQFFILKTASFNSRLKDKDSLLEMCKETNLSKLATNRLVMKYIENKTIKEIAEIENVEEGTISISLMRSKKKLK